MAKGHFILALAGLWCAGLVAAPVDLNAPSNELGASDLHGNLKIWREIGEVDFGKGLKLPIRAEFSSGEQGNSPYLGKGWRLPLVESVAFLKREKMMEVILLCGKTLYLRRNPKELNKFQTLDKEWTGIMEGDRITISRPDGWELRYSQGRLRQLRTDTGRVLTWNYVGNVVSEIREEGFASSGSPFRVLLGQAGVPKGLIVNGQQHGFELEKRPLVRSQGGINVIEGLEPSLASWTWPDGKKESYEFAVTPKIVPTLKLTNIDKQAATYTWDPASGHVLSDGEWTYKIGGIGEEITDLPRIERTNSNGEQEFTFTDQKAGITDRKTLEDGHKITQVFSSPGILYGKLRKIDQVDDKGNKTPMLQLSYDEKGRLFRQVDKNGYAIIFDYNKNGGINKKTIRLPIDPKNLTILKKKEESLLALVEQAPDKLTRGDALQALAFFYIHELRNNSRAINVLPLISNKLQRFNVEVHAIESDDALSSKEKAIALKNLSDQYPEKQQLLSQLIMLQAKEN